MTVKINGTNTAAAPAFTGADTDTGLQCGANEVKLVTDGTARVTVDSSGNLGLGTTSPNNQSSTGYTSLTLNNATSGSILDLRHNDTALSGGRMVGTANEFGLEARSQNAGSQISFYVNNAYAGRWTTNGLCFGNDTAAVNALDDYEEGTWTPQFANSSKSTANISSQPSTHGSYTKIGDRVFFNCWINGSLTTTETTQAIRIINLPYVVASAGDGYSALSVWHFNGFNSYGNGVNARNQNGDDQIVLQRFGADLTFDDIVKTSINFMISGQYHV